MTEVYLNSKFSGTVEDARGFVNRLREERRMGSVTSNLNVYHNETADEIYIESSKGRARRPLIVVKDGQPQLTEKHIKQLQKNEISWNDLVKQGVIEYLDAAEEENTLIAFTEQELTHEHTHLEISPLVMLGPITSLVPYGNYIPSARLSIGAKNQKQSIGYYASNFLVRMDMDVNLLHYPQVSIVQSI